MARRDIDPQQVFIGKKIKYMRRLYEMKLEELAAKTDLTASHISKLERGISLPSISALLRLSRVFNLPVSAFLGDGESNGPTHRKKGQRKTIQSRDGGITIELLNDILEGNPRSEVTLVTLAAGAGFRDKHLHKGEEIVYALKGKTEVELGSQSFTLEPGDSIDYPGTVPHLVRNAGKGEAVILACITPPNLRTDLD